ncbi:MAG TPA: MFS transporter [Solirubrobacteraceae bacterium]|nr:MFS transporter [Solirubrobacteraceae bacterium]
MAALAAVPAVRGRQGERPLTLIAVASGLAIVALDATIVAVAGPALGRHFDASLAGLQWVTNAYLLALAAGLVAGGKLGDRVGRRRVFLAGSIGFALASLACGLSGSLGVLIAFRAAQGLFGAAMAAQALAILRDIFPGESQATATGTWALASSVAVASGPIVGGLLLADLGWRSIFFIGVAVAGVALVLGAWAIRESRDENEDRILDGPGITLLSLGLVAVMCGLIVAEKHGWDRSHAVAFLLTGALMLASFAGWEGREDRVHKPHFPLGLFRSRALVAGAVIVLAVFAALFAVLFYVALYLQRVQGYSALETGVRILALTGVVALSSAASWTLARRTAPGGLVIGGAVLMAGGLFGLSQLDAHSSYGALWPYLALVGLGIGPAQAGAARGIVTSVRGEQAGIAADLHATAAQLGAVLGLTVLGSIITTRVSSVLPTRLIAAGVPRHLTLQLAGTAHSVAQGVVPIPRGLSTTAAHAVATGSFGAFASGLDTALLVAAAAVLGAGLLAGLIMRGGAPTATVHSLRRLESARG